MEGSEGGRSDQEDEFRISLQRPWEMTPGQGQQQWKWPEVDAFETLLLKAEATYYRGKKKEGIGNDA